MQAPPKRPGHRTADQKGPFRVLLVDDSPVILGLLSLNLSRHPMIEIVGTAADAYEARDKIKSLSPDLITLDVEMPRMSGLDFLERIMRLRPMPVVMFSSVTRDGSTAAIRALSLGAVDVLVKPVAGMDDAFVEDMATRIVTAAQTSLPHPTIAKGLQRIDTPVRSATLRRWNGRIVLIGASTGGVAALETVVSGLPVNCPPVVISQHMPDSFLRSFVVRLNDRSQQRVVVAEDGVKLEQGTIYMAPGGDSHTGVEERRGDIFCRRIDGPKRNGHYPSVDELFNSAQGFADRVIGVILTGLGKDGAEELAMLHQAGAATIGQNRDTCVVYGMPRAASELGALDRELPVGEIAAEICRLADRSFVRT